MQHPPELKTKFLELRAHGISYGQIAEAIRVSKPTLIQWGKAMAEDIADLQAAERELVREKLLGNFEQWLGRQVHHFNRLDEEFGRREFKYSPTESVFRMMMASRKLLDRYFFDDDRPSRGRAAAPPVAAPCQQSKIGNPKPEIQSASAPSRPCVEASEAQSNETERSEPPAFNQTENPSKTQPFPHQIDGGGIATAELQNPAFYPPFIHQKQGGSSSQPDNHNRNLNRPEPQGEPPATHSPTLAPAHPQSEPPLRHCVEAAPDTASAETQNPAKSLPFPSQNSGPHNSNLSTAPHLEGRAPSSPPPPSAVNPAEGRAMSPPSAESHNPNRNLNQDVNPSAEAATQPSTLNQPHLGNSGSGAIGNSDIHGSWNPPPGLISGRAAAPPASASPHVGRDVAPPASASPRVGRDVAPPTSASADVGRAAAHSNPAPRSLLPRGEGQDEGQTGISACPIAPKPDEGGSPLSHSLPFSPAHLPLAPNPLSPQPQQTPEELLVLDGESIPINPYESTRQWLERQGIQVSKIPKGARIITTG